MFRPSFPKKVSSTCRSSSSIRRVSFDRDEVEKRSGGLFVSGTRVGPCNQSNCSVHNPDCQPSGTQPLASALSLPSPYQRHHLSGPRDKPFLQSVGTSFGHWVHTYPGGSTTGSVCCRRRHDPTDEEEDRRGGISYDRADKNAFYVRALGDGRMRGKADLSDACQLLEWEIKLLEKLSVPECKIRFRSRFLSMHRIHRRRKARTKLTRENRPNVDDHYFVPAQALLDTVGSWDFNVFHLDSLTGGRSLLYLAFRIFREYNFIQRFHLDVIRLVRFFSSIEDNYHDSNPYHNVVHAADVTQAMFCYLQEEKLQQAVTPFETMLAVVSAMAHDLDHPGVNQSFLVATANHLATLYQNTSVLEMHHWRYGVGLMQESGVFSHFTNSQWALAIFQFRSLIMATDITRQQDFLIKFRRMLDHKEFEHDFNQGKRHFILQIALKCADICNPCRNWRLSEKWSNLVCEEFFRQGDMERKIGIEVSPVCDRHIQRVSKIQIGFMEIVVRPLFVEWGHFQDTALSQRMMANILANKQRWQTIEQETQAKARLVALSNLSNLESQSSTTDDESTRSSLDGNSNNTIFCPGEEEEELKPGEEEEDGEEADTVDNNVNLAFHYQTDSEQQSEVGGHSLSPVSEEEQLIHLARNARRRHSMPVVVRKDLAFYMGIRKDNSRGFLRRQSLPVTPVVRSSLLANGGLGDSVGKVLSVDGLMERPKISNLVCSVETRTDYLSFLSLQNQTQLLQQAGLEGREVAGGSVPHRQSSSCVELRQSPAFSWDSHHVRLVLSGVGSGADVCHHKLVGLASSWPSILRAGQKEKPPQVKLWGGPPPLPSMAADSVGASPSSSNSSSNTNLSSCLSSTQTEGVPLLSRPH